MCAQLNPVTYHFDLEKSTYMGLSTEKEYGFIAQEVREVLPEIISKDYQQMLQKKQHQPLK
jgi:hypothetical protein